MLVNTARFVTSNTDVSKCPSDIRHEFAFIGRSNVGKSSLINMLTGRKNLAMTSSTPGKTMLINHFMVNDQWYLVDLPGYGFAQRSKESRKQLRNIIESYILNRQQLTNLFVLVDGRLKPQAIDLEFMTWLGENGVPFSIVFTKLDKISSVAAKKQVEAYCATLLDQWEELPPIFRTSSVDRRGRDAILNYIEEMCKLPLGGEPKSLGERYEDKTEVMEKDTNKTKATVEAEEKYPGVAIDIADDEKVTAKEMEQQTKKLDFNPHSEGI